MKLNQDVRKSSRASIMCGFVERSVPQRLGENARLASNRAVLSFGGEARCERDGGGSPDRREVHFTAAKLSLAKNHHLGAFRCALLPCSLFRRHSSSLPLLTVGCARLLIRFANGRPLSGLACSPGPRRPLALGSSSKERGHHEHTPQGLVRHSTSSGFGPPSRRQVIARGDRLVATARDPEGPRRPRRPGAGPRPGPTPRRDEAGRAHDRARGRARPLRPGPTCS